MPKKLRIDAPGALHHIIARGIGAIHSLWPPKLKGEFETQLKEEERLNTLIVENLGKVKIKGKR